MQDGPGERRAKNQASNEERGPVEAAGFRPAHGKGVCADIRQVEGNLLKAGLEEKHDQQGMDGLEAREGQLEGLGAEQGEQPEEEHAQAGLLAEQVGVIRLEEDEGVGGQRDQQEGPASPVQPG